jgi:hypothetical protein
MTKKINKIDYTNVPKTLANHSFYGLELDEEQKAFHRDNKNKRTLYT